MEAQGPTATSWLCPQPADRVRAVDMEARLKPVRRMSFVVLAAALVCTAPWVGWWTLAPLALAVIGFSAVDRRLERSARPEVGIAWAWVVSELAIAGSVAVTGGPHAAALPWLVIPLVTLPARFTGRAVAAGVLFVAALMCAVTLGVDAGEVVDRPDLLLAPVALLVSIALLSTALMRSDLEHRSSSVIDPLTGMLNRNALVTRVTELSQQAAIMREPVALVVCDLDRFKAVNDSHGHAAGDAVLRDVAYRMRKALRAYDLAYRLGGEEFLVVLPGGDAAKGAVVAESLRAAIADEPIAGLLVTMSFGVSASPPGDFDYDKVFAEADIALYRAKREGRNRVRVAGDAPGEQPAAVAA
jgi:diguanylate cyclase (GGDEF)-like protein